MLLTLREFALEQLARREESDQYQRRHAEYYRRLAQQASEGLHGPQQIELKQQLELELDNLRTALDWAIQHNQVQTALLISAGLLQFWEMSGRFSEGSRWLSSALQAAEAAGPHECNSPGYTRALFAAAWLARWQGALEIALRRILESRASAERQNDLAGIAWAETLLVSLQNPSPDYLQARQTLSHCLEMFRQLDDQRGVGRALQAFGTQAYYHQDFTTARAMFLEAREIFQQRGDLTGMAHLYNNLGLVSQAHGDPIEARLWHEQALELRRRLGVRPWLAQTLYNLARAVSDSGAPGQALPLLKESLRIRSEVGAAIGVMECLEALGAFSAQYGRPESAAFLLGAAEAQRRQSIAQMDAYQASQHAAILERLSQRLPAADLQTAWNAGQAAPLEQAIQAALDLPE